MALWELLGTIALSIYGVYVYLTTDNKGRFLVFSLIVAVFVGELYCRFRLDMSLTEYFPRKVRYCSAPDKDAGCMLSWEYERVIMRRIDVAPLKSVCDMCAIPEKLVPIERIKYVRVEERSLLQNDIQQLEALIDRPIAEFASNLSQMAGVADILQPAPPGRVDTVGESKVYVHQIGRDGVLGTIVRFKPGCVGDSALFVTVRAERIAGIDWVGSVEKICFDTIWMPALGKLRDFRIDEQYRPMRVIDTIVRSHIADGRHLLIATSRSPRSTRRQVGVRVSVISASAVPLPWPMAEAPFKQWFLGTENLAMQ